MTRWAVAGACILLASLAAMVQGADEPGPGDARVPGWTAGDSFEYAYADRASGGPEPTALPWYRGQVDEAGDPSLPLVAMELAQGVPGAWRTGDENDTHWSSVESVWWWAADAHPVRVEAPGSPRPAHWAPGQLPGASLTGLLPGSEVTVQESTRQASRTVDHAPGLPSCLLALKSGAPVTSPFAACVLTAPEREAAADRFASHPARATVHRLPDGAAFAYLGAASPGLHVVQRGDVTAWLSEDLPVPERVEVADGEGVHVYSLSRFGHGSGAQLAPAPAPKPAPAVPSVPAPRHGMSEAGVGHPYPASAAVGEAGRDADVARFLERHPRARLVGLDGALVVDNWLWTSTQVRWTMVLSDGDDALEVRVDARLAGDARTVDSPVVTSGPTAPVAAPAALPTVASLVPPTVGEDALLLWGFSGETAWLRAVQDHWDADAPGRSFVEHGVVVDGGVLRQTWRTELDKSVGPRLVEQASALPDAPAVVPRTDPSWTPWAASAALFGLALLLKMPLAALYARITRADLLRHPTRARIVEEVQASPGIHLGGLQSRTGCGYRTLRHHLEKLVKAGLLLRRKGKAAVCFFPLGSCTDRMRSAEVLVSPTALATLEVVVRCPGLPLGRIARQVGVSASTLGHHARRLRDAGLVEVRSVGRSRCAEPTPLGIAALAGGRMPH